MLRVLFTIKQIVPRHLLILFLFFLYTLFPSTVFSKSASEADAWHAIEQGFFQVYKRYDPENPLLKSEDFSKTVSAYLDAGLWSSAETLLNASTDPSAERLNLELKFLRGKFAETYRSYQEAPELFNDRPELILAAAQGALAQKNFGEALNLLATSDIPETFIPKKFYLSALAHWGRQDKTRLQQTFDQAEQ